MGKTKQSTSAKDRLLTTADRLFYAEGIHSVGIDRIIAEADVAKMTLYNHFPSKDDLVLAVLEFRERKILAYFDSAMTKYEGKGKDRLEAFFAALKDWFKGPRFRGCAFINTALEFPDPQHPAAVFSAEHKRRFHRMITEIVQETTGNKDAATSRAIALIVEGAIVAAVMEQKPNSADAAKKAALALVSQANRR